MLTVKTIAERLGVSSGLIYREIAECRLSSYRIGGAIRVSEEQLAAYLLAQSHSITSKCTCGERIAVESNGLTKSSAGTPRTISVAQV